MRNGPTLRKDIHAAVMLGLLSLVLAICGSVLAAAWFELSNSGNIWASKDNFTFAVIWGACMGLFPSLGLVMLKFDRSAWVRPRPITFLLMLVFITSCITHLLFIKHTASV